MSPTEPVFEPVIRRVILRTPHAERLARFYHQLLGVIPQQDPTSDSLLTLVHPQSGAALLTLL